MRDEEAAEGFALHAAAIAVRRGVPSALAAGEFGSLAASVLRRLLSFCFSGCAQRPVMSRAASGRQQAASAER